MKSAGLLMGMALVAWCLAADQSQAQMFRTRAGSGILGQDPLGTNAGGGAGTLNFNERFIRGNRRAGSFVGTDAQSKRQFVGSQQGSNSGRARPAAADLRIRAAPDANRTAAPPVQSRSGPYEPRLAVGFQFTRPTDRAVAEALARQLQGARGFQPTGRIEVSVEDGTATLRGEVASERDRTLAETLALFEPGIAAVRNELKVTRPPRSSPEAPPPAASSPSDRKTRTGARE